MHESNSPNQEISPVQEGLFTSAIEDLRRLMGQPQMEVESLDSSVDGESPPDSIIFVSTEASFDLPGKKIDVYIDESTGVKDSEDGESAKTKRFALMTTEHYSQEGDKKIFIQKIYETNDYTGPNYSEHVFSLDTKTGEHVKVRNPDTLAMSQDLEKVESGEMSQKEMMDRVRERIEAKEAFEEQLGEFSNRFTVERFSEAMVILDQLDESNLAKTKNWRRSRDSNPGSR